MRGLFFSKGCCAHLVLFVMRGNLIPEKLSIEIRKIKLNETQSNFNETSHASKKIAIIIISLLSWRNFRRGIRTNFNELEIESFAFVNIIQVESTL